MSRFITALTSFRRGLATTAPRPVGRNMWNYNSTVAPAVQQRATTPATAARPASVPIINNEAVFLYAHEQAMIGPHGPTPVCPETQNAILRGFNAQQALAKRAAGGAAEAGRFSRKYRF